MDKQKRMPAHFAMVILYCFVFSLFFTGQQLATQSLFVEHQKESSHSVTDVKFFSLSAITQTDAFSSIQHPFSTLKNQLKSFIDGWKNLEFDLINKVAGYLSYTKAALPYSPSVNIIYPFHSHW